VVALLLVAVSIGLSNFAASIGLGASGADRRTRLRVAVIFAVFEGGMPVLGVLLGRGLAGTLGRAANWAGAGLLIAVGGWALIQALRRPPEPGGGRHGASLGQLVLTGLALSIDNLAAGFAIGTYQVGLALAAVIMAGVSVGLSMIGLELGSRLGDRLGGQTGNRSELLGGLVLIGVGIAIAAGVP
jgi:putative Mn2+ efflux pump MntP